MKNPVFPLSTWKPDLEASFDLEDSDDILAIVRQLIDGNHPGILTTVDGTGCPHARWMSTIGFEQFPKIYTLTAPKSSKLSHIAGNPQVDWMFSNHDLTLVLNLTGRAEVISDPVLIKNVWKMIEDKSHAYFLNNFTERPGFAVVKTVVERVYCCIPQSGFRWSVEASALVAG